MEPYTKFVDNTIFKDREVNVFCDKIYTALQNHFDGIEPEVIIVNHFLLSGRVAAIIQGEEYDEVNNIIFQTDEVAVYEWLIQNLPAAFSGAKSLALKNRILIYGAAFIMEVWFSETTLDPKTFENIKVQFKPAIPEILL
jgi:hypothetical protein